MNDFKVLLVYPNLQMVNLMPTNIALLTACLKNAGMQVELFDTTLYKTAEKSLDDIRVEHMQVRPFNLNEKGVSYKTTNVFSDFVRLVDRFKPDVIAVTVVDDTYNIAIDLIAKIDKKNIHVIFGGIRATFSPDDVINNENIDSVCIGEGEEALVELCLKLQAKENSTDIKNLWVKKDGKVYKNELRKPADINDLPYDDFSLFEEKRFYRPMQGKVYRMIPVTIDRGCPFNCAFCAAPNIRKVYDDAGYKSFFRVKRVDRIFDELKFYIKTYKADYIYFNSETFFAGKLETLKTFAKRYADEIKLPFWCQTRIETITRDTAKLLKDMGCDRLSIGLEHGNENFRKKFLKKTFLNEDVIKAFKILNAEGLKVTINNIIGFPDETRELVFDTINLNRCIKADSINAYYFAPYRGTPLREYCIDKGYILENVDSDSLIGSSVLRMPQISQDEIKGLVRTFPLYVKMPKTHFNKIKKAEKLDTKGNKVFKELRDVFFREYFN